MESHTSVRLASDELTDNDDGASTLSWPPRDDGIGPGAVDLGTADFRVEPAAAARRESSRRIRRFAQPAPDEAVQKPLETGGEAPHRTPRRVRVAVGALAALALVEAIVIVLLFTGNEQVRQIAVMSRERFRRQHATGAASSAASPSAPVPAPANAVRMPPATAQAVPETGGRLEVRTDRAGAAVIVDGERRGTAPLTVRGLAPGTHRVRLVAGDRSVEETVAVQPDVATALVMPMGRPAPAAGWMELVLPFEAQIFEQGRLVGTSAQSRLQFSAGEHRFELANDALGYRAVQIVRVKPGEVAQIRPEVPTGLISINATPWAEVWIDGRQAGTTPLGNVRVPLGTRLVRFRHPELGEETRRVLVTTTEPARVSLDFRP